jgi:hypothetical protein
MGICVWTVVGPDITLLNTHTHIYIHICTSLSICQSNPSLGEVASCSTLQSKYVPVPACMLAVEWRLSLHRICTAMGIMSTPSPATHTMPRISSDGREMESVGGIWNDIVSNQVLNCFGALASASPGPMSSPRQMYCTPPRFPALNRRGCFQPSLCLFLCGAFRAMSAVSLDFLDRTGP